MDCKKFYIIFTFSFLLRKAKTCLMWHVFSSLLGEFFVTEPLTHLLCWSTFSALWNFATHWQSLCKKAEDNPPNIYLSSKFWHVLKCNRVTWNPDSYFLDKYSNRKATAQNGNHYHNAIFFCSKRRLKNQTGTISFRPHIQACLLGITGSAC